MAKSRTEFISDTNNESNQLLRRRSVPIPDHSSSSSIESTHGTNVNINGNPSLMNSSLTATTSSTTTDSDLESEQDDNLQSQPQKSDSSASDPLSRSTKHFQKLFQSEIQNEMPEVIDSYVCAYQGDILLQGKLYITDRYLCFHSRIISYVTKHVYRWDQIKRITKERVAYIFPTAIGIQLKSNNKKIIYASFLLRDQAYEKIISIWSQFNPMSHSIDDDDDDDDNEIAHGGTLKATNSNERNKSRIQDAYGIIEGSEQEVLQLCLKDSQKTTSSNPRKNSDEKQSGKKFEKKLSTKSLSPDQKLSNGDTNINPTIRQSRYTKNEQKSIDKTKKNTSLTNRRSKSRQRTPSRTDSITTVSTPTSILPSPVSNSTSNETRTFPYQIYQNLSSLLPSYSMQTTIIILFILFTLFLHSFYLIKLAHRIEYRLQSLHHLWPSTSTMKNSFS